MADVWSYADAVRWRQQEDRGEGNMMKALVHEAYQMDDVRTGLEGVPALEARRLSHDGG